MTLTDLMLQKLQIALHVKLFKYVSQVLGKNQTFLSVNFLNYRSFTATLLMPSVKKAKDFDIRRAGAKDTEWIGPRMKKLYFLPP